MKIHRAIQILHSKKFLIGLITLIPDVCVIGCDTVAIGMHVVVVVLVGVVVVVVVNTARHLHFGVTFKWVTTRFWHVYYYRSCLTKTFCHFLFGFQNNCFR